jgi:XTP/dITP diphosphohydrolase
MSQFDGLRRGPFLSTIDGMTIWFASGNVHKKAELAAIFAAETGGAFPPELKIPADAGLYFDPEETGACFSENALLKARALYRLLRARRPLPYQPGDPVIADDSGLCVDALNGGPGVYSARYGGENLSSAERSVLLLEELGDQPRRSARFVCAMVLLYGPEQFRLVQETLEGEIVDGPEAARGAGGFGYDPVFSLPGAGRTLAELTAAEKNSLSHRGKAGKVIARLLAGG